MKYLSTFYIPIIFKSIHLSECFKQNDKTEGFPSENPNFVIGFVDDMEITERFLSNDEAYEKIKRLRKNDFERKKAA